MSNQQSTPPTQCSDFNFASQFTQPDSTVPVVRAGVLSRFAGERIDESESRGVKVYVPEKILHPKLSCSLEHGDSTGHPASPEAPAKPKGLCTVTPGQSKETLLTLRDDIDRKTEDVCKKDGKGRIESNVLTFSSIAKNMREFQLKGCRMPVKDDSRVRRLNIMIVPRKSTNFKGPEKRKAEQKQVKKSVDQFEDIRVKVAMKKKLELRNADHGIVDFRQTDYVIFPSGLNQEQLQALESLAAAHSEKVQIQVRFRPEVITHVVIDYSERFVPRTYENIAAAGLQIPFVSFDWVNGSLKTGLIANPNFRSVPFWGDDYCNLRAKSFIDKRSCLFAGSRFVVVSKVCSMTGFHMEQIKNIIRAFGGEVLEEQDSYNIWFVTIILDSPDEYEMSWKKSWKSWWKVLNFQWIFDCIHYGELLDTNYYSQRPTDQLLNATI